jgi:hypothetical protein
MTAKRIGVFNELRRNPMPWPLALMPVALIAIPAPAIQNLAAQEIGELAHGSDAWTA